MAVAVDFGRGLFGQRPPQVVQEELLGHFGLGNSRQANAAALAQVKPDLDQQDLFELMERLRGG